MSRLLLALGFAFTVGCAHARSFETADRAAIVELLRAQQDAWNRGDLDAFLRAYEPGPGLVFTSGGRVRRGYEETRARYQTRYQSEAAAMGHLDFELLDIRSLGPDGAIVLGRWRLSSTPQAGEGVFSLAFLRTPAGWRIVHDHTSLTTP
jgi:uncharacterized protein (TIGR02246 family)